MEGTVISDDVNLASRIESLTKEYGAALIISERTFENLKNPDLYALRALAHVIPKGKSKPVKIFEVCDGDSWEMREQKLATKELFEEAVELFKNQNHRDAEKIFQECLLKNPQDMASQIYIARCKESVV